MVVISALLLLYACASSSTSHEEIVNSKSSGSNNADYLIGPGDTLEVYVWQNPEITTTVQVRPDGKISTPLVDDLVAVGKTPSQLSRDVEKELGKYIRKPVVNVMVTNFVGYFGEQIRVVGQATKPQSLQYREGITLLDVIIEVGGLTEFAAGNRAKVVRKTDGESKEIQVRLNDLLNKGKISENIVMKPGDILIIPESFF
jgi:polysaccharide export outer membrane protein